MLVLSRKIGQRIVLPETHVSISVLGVQGQRVRIGIEAPQGVSVHREEVWQRILDLTAPAPAAAPIDERGSRCPAA